MTQNRCLLFATIIFSSFFLQADNVVDSEWTLAVERAQKAVVHVINHGLEVDPFQPYKTPKPKMGEGSGFFIDRKGRILTNYHVVSSERYLYINVPKLGGTQLGVKVVGTCPELDVALLELTDESREIIGEIEPLEFGNSDNLEEAQKVIAFGFPLGHPSMKSTIGNVAGPDFIDGSALIHITAPINPGNSGGPVLTKNAKVVGISTAHWANSQNYNYIVPEASIRAVLEQMHTKKLVRRPDFVLGVNRGTTAHAKALGNPTPPGLFINFVIEGSEEQKAGFQNGDMLYEVTMNGKTYKIDEFGDTHVEWRPNQKISISELFTRYKSGDPISWVVYRNGTRVEINCSFDADAVKLVRPVYYEFEPQEFDNERIGGMVVMQLRENHYRALRQEPAFKNLKEFTECARIENLAKPSLIITHIMVGSQVALSECIGVAMVIDKINGNTVRTLEELREALMLSAKTKQLAIKTKDRAETVLDINKVLEDEPRLANDFRYVITETVWKLIQEVSTSKQA